MNRRGFLKALGFGALIAPVATALGHQTPPQIVSTSARNGGGSGGPIVTFKINNGHKILTAGDVSKALANSHLYLVGERGPEMVLVPPFSEVLR